MTSTVSRMGAVGALAAGAFVLLSLPSLLAFSVPWRGIEDYAANAGDLHLVTYALWWLVSLAFLATMAALHAGASATQRPLTLLALALSVPYATLVSVSYVLQMTFVRHALRAGETEGLATWVVANPSAPVFALDILGYLFLSLATLAAAYAFHRERFGRALRVLYLVHGVSGAAGFVTLFLPPSTWEGDSAASVLVLAAWPLLFGPMMLLTAAWFRRRAAPQGSAP